MSETPKTPAPESAGEQSPPAAPRVSPLAKLREKFKHLCHKAGFVRQEALSPIEKGFVSLILGLMVFALGSLVFVTLHVLHSLKPHQIVATHAKESQSNHPETEGSESSSAEVETKDHDSSHASDEAGSGSILTQAAIPKSILDRQNGKLEEGQDLVEPQIQKNRSLSALVKSEILVEGPPKYVNLFEIIAASKGSKKGDAVVLGDFVLVMSDYEAQVEAQNKETQLKALVGSLISDLDREELRSFRGKAALKTAIQREINHQLTKGHVKDILFSKFLVR
jgi:flagellar basal body-associated protein FliL